RCSACVPLRWPCLWRLAHCGVVLRLRAAHARDPTLSAIVVMLPRSGASRAARGRERERVEVLAQKVGPSLDVAPGVCPCVSCTDLSLYTNHTFLSFTCFFDGLIDPVFYTSWGKILV